MSGKIAASPACASAVRWVPGIVHVPAGYDQAGDAGHDQERPGGEQQPGAADGGELAELAADVRQHGRPPQFRAVVRLRNADSSAPCGRADVAQRSGEPEFPRADDHHVIGGPGHLAQLVAGDDDRASLRGQAAQRAAQPGDAARVQAVGRLVEDQHLGIAEHGRRQPEALPHAERELPHGPSRGRGEADLVQHLVHPPGRNAVRRGQDPQVIAGPAARVKARRLQHRADHPARPVQAAVADAADERFPGTGLDQAERDAQGGGLPRPVRAEQAGDHPGRGGERHVPHRRHPAEGLGQSADLEFWHASLPYERAFMNICS